MRDKTHSMNAEQGGEGAMKGYTDPGKPELTNASHKRRMQQGGLAEDEALQCYENVDGDDGGGVYPGGFLRRNNYDERF